jgi:UDP-2-acetamido-3-amino-2,3-dideoxy-glucuronate N-acetyltransferase
MQIRFQRFHVFIGAEAVVTKDVPDYALMLGNPAQVAGWMCECGEKLRFEENESCCKACGLTYMNINGKLIKSIEESSFLKVGTV